MIIYKYPLLIGSNVLQLLSGSKILHVAEQHGQLMMWALHSESTSQHSEFRRIHVLPTGQEFHTKNLVYINTVLSERGLVWHIFEEK